METATWEESQRQLVAQDLHLMQQFQLLKYINSEQHPSRILGDVVERLTFTLKLCAVGLLVSVNLFLFQLKTCLASVGS